MSFRVSGHARCRHVCDLILDQGWSTGTTTRLSLLIVVSCNTLLYFGKPLSCSTFSSTPIKCTGNAINFCFSSASGRFTKRSRSELSRFYNATLTVSFHGRSVVLAYRNLQSYRLAACSFIPSTNARMSSSLTTLSPPLNPSRKSFSWSLRASHIDQHGPPSRPGKAQEATQRTSSR